MSSSVLIGLANHAWQSTLFAGVIGGLVLLMRRNSARVRYSLWLIASVKFLVPFSVLTALGAQIPWSFGASPAAETTSFVSIAGQVVQFGSDSATAITRAAHGAEAAGLVLIALEVLWALGALAVVARWLARWQLVRRALRESTETAIAFATPVRLSSSQLEPAVVGVLRPVLLLPQGLQERLTPAEMRAVLAHEGCHVMWRDNLAAALHMIVEAVFWFHPLVWWVGARLVEERERACDEHVLASGHGPENYAEGILKVCEHFLESRLPCVSGVSGADLKQRIEDIMKNRTIERLNGARQAVLAVAAGATFAVPVALGIVTAPRALAVTEPAATDGALYSNLSIKLAAPDSTSKVHYTLLPGRMELTRATLRNLIASAYDVAESQVTGRDWSKEPAYDITADLSHAVPYQTSRILQDLLAKQFGLVVRREPTQMDGYVLLIGSAGTKVKANGNNPVQTMVRASPDSVDMTNAPIAALAQFLQRILLAPVVDQTGLQGGYDYKANWTPSAKGVPADPAAITQALDEQAGLHLEARPVTVDVLKVVGLKAPNEILTN